MSTVQNDQSVIKTPTFAEVPIDIFSCSLSIVSEQFVITDTDLSCSKSQDCRGDEVCQRGTCVMRSGGACSSHLHCRHDQVCIRGKCKRKKCAFESDCSLQDDPDIACNQGLCSGTTVFRLYFLESGRDRNWKKSLSGRVDWMAGVDITKVAKSAAIQPNIEDDDDTELTEEEKSFMGEGQRKIRIHNYRLLPIFELNSNKQQLLWAYLSNSRKIFNLLFCHKKTYLVWKLGSF